MVTGARTIMFNTSWYVFSLDSLNTSKGAVLHKGTVSLRLLAGSNR